MKKIIFFTTSVLLVLFAFSHTARAATISLVPTSSSVQAGNIVTVNVFVDTQGQAINTGDVTVQFPTDLLQVLSISKNSSIFSLWVQDPSFSNITGQISFDGGLPDPGYTGSTGEMVSVTFRALKAGTASLLFSSDSSILANDGLGTDILSGENNTSLTITQPSALPATTAVTESPAPVENSIITSPTDPDQNAWYDKSEALLQWTLPPGALSVETLLGSHPDSIPTVAYTPAISEKDISHIDDGVWYFHMRYQTTTGWSPTAHYRLQIDTVAPTDVVVTSAADTAGTVTVHMSASDALSGIDHYTLAVDQGQPLVVNPASDGTTSSTFAGMFGGEHTFLVTAYDRAGNMTQATSTITVNTPLAIAITSYPKTVKVGQMIKITGQASLADTPIAVSLTIDGTKVETYTVQSDSNGVFHFTSEKLETSGIEVVWADMENANGASIASSEKVSIVVKKPVLIQIGSYTTELLSVLIPMIALLLLLIFLIYFGWHKFFSMRRRVKKDLDAAQVRIHNAFKTLSEEATEQLHKVERSSKRRVVSEDEATAMQDLKAAIADVDTYIEKLVGKIKKEDM